MRVLERLPPWPAGVSREAKARARVRGVPTTPDALALATARATADRLGAIRNSGMTGTWAETIWNNGGDFTAVANTSSEASLLAGPNTQPVLPALFFHRPGKYRTVSLLARGVLSTTGTPTIIFQVRLGTTVGSTYLSGTSVGVSAAITTSSGVTNKAWELVLDLTCNTEGLGTGNTTLSGAGFVHSPGGFAAPYAYPLEPSTPDTATWTSTVDGALSQYLNVSVTWSAASASNTITCKMLRLLGLN